MKLLLFLLLLTIADSAVGCYLFGENNSGDCIGKRIAYEDKNTQSHKCPSCGIDGIGECYSSRVCCHPSFGCVTSTNMVQMSSCYLEQYNATAPCVNQHELCSIGAILGVCNEGLCCTIDSCAPHESCFEAPQENPIASRQQRMDEFVESDIPKRFDIKHSMLPFGFWAGKRTGARRANKFQILRKVGIAKRPFSWSRLVISKPSGRDRNERSEEN